MSTFRYPIEIGDTNQRHFQLIDAWVDSGASYTWIPRSVLEGLGYVPTGRRRFRLADGSVLEREICRVYLRIDQDVQFSLCVLGDEGSEPLLGATALEEFAFGIDPPNHTLIPVVMNMLSLRELSPTQELVAKGKAVRSASRTLARLSGETKDLALLNIAEALGSQQNRILEANQKDYTAGVANGLSESLLDRLLLNPQRLEAMARDVGKVAGLPDPVDEVLEMRDLPNGLTVGRVQVPLGVIGVIYESRPNVTIDISVLCLKSGNGCILRGGKEAFYSNRALSDLVRGAIAAAGVPEDAVQFVDNTDRALVESMLNLKEYIDLIIPRGGADFIRFVSEEAAMPVVTGGIGVCHIYVDSAADLDMAVNIAMNAKTQRPSVCNALDTLLVHSSVAPEYLPAIVGEWSKAGVEIRCDGRSLSMLGPVKDLNTVSATEDDWGKEFLALIAAVRVVDSLEEALEHIERYGSGHSEAIITEDDTAASRFLKEVDAAAVLVNASTRFVDGGEFGLGAEVGISTQKFHARGPMGLRELTSYKWIVRGSGQIRG